MYQVTQFHNKAKNGEPYYVHATIIPMLDKNHDIEGYTGIRFLSTNEETEKRDFRKKVRTNIIEYKKTTAHLEKRNIILEKENQVKSENEIILLATIEDLNSRLKKSLTKLEEFEELKKSENSDDDRKYGVMKNYNKNLEHMTHQYTESSKLLTIKKAELTSLKNDNILKKEEIIRLTNELINQRYIIKDLRSTIEDISDNQEKENKDNNENTSIFSKFLRIK